MPPKRARAGRTPAGSAEPGSGEASASTAAAPAAPGAQAQQQEQRGKPAGENAGSATERAESPANPALEKLKKELETNMDRDGNQKHEPATSGKAAEPADAQAEASGRRSTRQRKPSAKAIEAQAAEAAKPSKGRKGGAMKGNGKAQAGEGTPQAESEKDAGKEKPKSSPDVEIAANDEVESSKKLDKGKAKATDDVPGDEGDRALAMAPGPSGNVIAEVAAEADGAQTRPADNQTTEQQTTEAALNPNDDAGPSKNNETARYPARTRSAERRICHRSKTRNEKDLEVQMIVPIPYVNCGHSFRLVGNLGAFGEEYFSVERTKSHERYCTLCLQWMNHRPNPGTEVIVRIDHPASVADHGRSKPYILRDLTSHLEEQYQHADELDEDGQTHQGTDAANNTKQTGNSPAKSRGKGKSRVQKKLSPTIQTDPVALRTALTHLDNTPAASSTTRRPKFKKPRDQNLSDAYAMRRSVEPQSTSAEKGDENEQAGQPATQTNDADDNTNDQARTTSGEALEERGQGTEADHAAEKEDDQDQVAEADPSKTQEVPGDEENETGRSSDSQSSRKRSRDDYEGDPEEDHSNKKTKTSEDTQTQTEQRLEDEEDAKRGEQHSPHGSSGDSTQAQHQEAAEQ